MKHFLILGIAALLVAGCARNERDTAQERTQAKPEAQAQAGVANAAPIKLIDVRTPGEFEINHAEGAINVPLNELAQRIGSVAPDKNAPLVVHCQTGGRSAPAKATLEKMGYKDVIDVATLANAKAVSQGKDPRTVAR